MANKDPLYKNYLFPALGLAADIAIIAAYGFPPALFMVAFFVFLVIGSIFTYTDWKDGGDSNVPMIIATAGPILSLIFGFAV